VSLATGPKTNSLKSGFPAVASTVGSLVSIKPKASVFLLARSRCPAPRPWDTRIRIRAGIGAGNIFVAACVPRAVTRHGGFGLPIVADPHENSSRRLLHQNTAAAVIVSGAAAAGCAIVPGF
jgi:hypothetical protein